MTNKAAISLLCALLAAGTVGCGRAGSHTGEKPAPSTPPAGSQGKAAPAPAVKKKTAAAFVLPIPDLGYNAREGRVIYRHYCLNCHGEEGHGDGFNAYNLDPKPKDLADPAFQAKRTDEDLVSVIRSGGGVAGLSTAMPPWGRTLSERKIQDLVDYLRTLPSAAKQD